MIHRLGLRDYFFYDLWQTDLSQVGRWRRVWLQSLRAVYVFIRELANGQLNLRAMSLVYTTLLSLVPLLAVSFSVLKAFGVHNQLVPVLANFLAALGPQGEELAHRVVAFVANIKVGVLGVVGLLFLLFTAVTLIQKVEEAFNYVWRVRRARPLAQRFSDYLSVIIVGPLLVFSALGLSTAVFNARLLRRLALMEPFGTIVAATGQVIPYLLVIAGFSFLYVFMPNTRVRWHSALVGGVVGGVMWHTVGLLFASFGAASASYAAIYSGFAIVLLFIIWLWMSWIILLFGAQVAYFHQHPHQIRLGRGDFRLSNRLKEQTALVILYLVTERYMRGGPPWNMDGLVHRLLIPGEALEELIPVLMRHQFLVESEQEGEYCYLPARDPATITVVEVVRAVRAAEEEGYRVESFRLDVPAVAAVMSTMADQADAAARHRSIRDLVEQGPAATPGLLESGAI